MQDLVGDLRRRPVDRILRNRLGVDEPRFSSFEEGAAPAIEAGSTNAEIAARLRDARGLFSVERQDEAREGCSPSRALFFSEWQARSDQVDRLAPSAITRDRRKVQRERRRATPRWDGARRLLL